MRRRWAVFCMALWIGGTILVALVAAENFYTVDRLIEAKANPAFNAAIEKLGASESRDLLLYLSSELNRLFLQVWGIFAMALGVFTLWLIAPLPRSRRSKWMIVSMIAIELLFAALIVPKMVSVGRELDFTPSDFDPGGHRTFGLLQAAYTVLDMVKLILGILVTLWLTRQSVSEPFIAIHRS